MKNWLLSLGCVAVFLCGIQSAWAAGSYKKTTAPQDGSQNLFSKIRISLSSLNPPRPAASNSTLSATGTWRNKWLVIAVEYTPNLPLRTRNRWIDDVSLTIRAIFNGQSNGRAQAILFTGKSAFVTIPVDNRKHVATMMIPPQLLDRYLPSSGTGSTVSATSTFTLEVVFRDRAGTVIGAGYYGQRWSDEKYAEYFSRLNDSAVKTIQGAIYPRSQTPWAFHDIDSYDILRPVGGSGAKTE